MTINQPDRNSTAPRRRPLRHRVRRWIVRLGLVLALLAGALIAPRLYAQWWAQRHIYTLDNVPPRSVAIIFGARIYPNGRPSAMLADRVRTGADLYHAGKVDVLLLTGDNSLVEYNEPEAMRRYALRLGVPDEAIVLDYAGFRTYDSCYRARDIFQVEDAILVTQAFHLPRALLICDNLGLDVVGVAADVQRPQGYSLRSLVFSETREIPATALAVFDLLRRPEPVLGDPLPIVSTRE